MDNEFSGIVMFTKPHKDVDAMVKVFTLEYGKQMFFVRRFSDGQHHLKSVLFSGTQAIFLGKINHNGLSFLRDYKAKKTLWRQMDDVVIQAYVSYFITMCDAVVDDRIVNEPIFYLLSSCLDLVAQDKDIDIISMMFELKMLAFWGWHFRFDECVITHQQNVKFDFSFKYGGCIAQNVWEKDNYRLQIDPNAIYMMNRLQKIPFEKVGDINVSTLLKSEMQRAIDLIYDEYVGIKLKSKQYIRDLTDWYNGVE